MTPTPPETLDPRVRRALGPLIAGRFSSNLAVRFVYPFLPTIARGLGVSLEAAGVAISIRELTGLAGPVVGRATDRGQERGIMVVGLGLLAVATAVGGLSTELGLFTVAMALVALGQMAYMISSAMVVPIILGNELFGVLSVTSRTANVGYTQEDLQSLQILGEHAGICARFTEGSENARMAA